MKKLVFEGTEQQLENLKLLIQLGDNDLPTLKENYQYTDKDLFELALGQFVSNLDRDIVESILEEDDWSEVDLWEPFEDYEINDIHEMVLDFQGTLIKIRDSK